MSDQHLKEEDLARRWGLSVRTLQRWRWAKKGPPYLKIGHRVVYRLSDIEAWEEATRCVPPAHQPEVEPRGPLRDR